MTHEYEDGMLWGGFTIPGEPVECGLWVRLRLIDNRLVLSCTAYKQEEETQDAGKVVMVVGEAIRAAMEMYRPGGKGAEWRLGENAIKAIQELNHLTSEILSEEDKKPINERYENARRNP